LNGKNRASIPATKCSQYSCKCCHSKMLLRFYWGRGRELLNKLCHGVPELFLNLQFLKRKSAASVHFSVKLPLPLLLSPFVSLIVNKGNSNYISDSFKYFLSVFQYWVKLQLPFLLSAFVSLIINKGNSNSTSACF